MFVCLFFLGCSVCLFSHGVADESSKFRVVTIGILFARVGPNAVQDLGGNLTVDQITDDCDVGAKAEEGSIEASRFVEPVVDVNLGPVQKVSELFELDQGLWVALWDEIDVMCKGLDVKLATLQDVEDEVEIKRPVLHEGTIDVNKEGLAKVDEGFHAAPHVGGFLVREGLGGGEDLELLEELDLLMVVVVLGLVLVLEMCDGARPRRISLRLLGVVCVQRVPHSVSVCVSLVVVCCWWW